jgi:hypothetical protein
VISELGIFVGEWSVQPHFPGLLRESADFSPCDFAQRFTATFSGDGDRIDGAWEKALPRLGLGA